MRQARGGPMSSNWKFETLSVHAGYSPEPTTRAVAPPIYQTVAYAFDSAQHGADLFDLKVPGNIYTRINNPTQDVLEQRVAALEGGIAARFAEHRDPKSVDELFDEKTKAVFVESLGNPAGNVTDIAAIAEIAHR